MLFSKVRYIVLLASLSTAYHKVNHVHMPRSLDRGTFEDPYLSRRSEPILTVRYHDGFANTLRRRGKSPSNSPPKGRSPQGSSVDSSRHQLARTKTGTVTQSSSEKQRTPSPERGAARGKVSGASPPLSGRKSPDGLYHNPFFDKSQRISPDTLNRLFPASTTPKLHLSIDRSPKRSLSPVRGAKGPSISPPLKKPSPSGPRSGRSGSPTRDSELNEALDFLESPHKQ